MPNDPLTLTVSMNGEDARAFLRALAEDESFRERLRTKPQATLASANIALPAEVVPEKLDHLPSKESFEEFLMTGFPSAPNGAGREGPRPEPPPVPKPPPKPKPGPPYGGCLMWSILYAIAAQSKT